MVSPAVSERKSELVVHPGDDFGRILVVDSDHDWLSDSVSMLEKMGYATAKASNVAQAFNRISDHDISTVIVDHTLPEGDGISLIYALAGRVAVTGRKLQFILVSARPTVDMAVAAIRASVVDLLEKPFPPAALNAALMRIRAMRAEVKSVEPFANQLSALSEEMQRLASLLNHSKSGEEPSAGGGGARAARTIDGNLVKRLIRVERARSAAVGGKILGDPAWNILLDLLLASIEGRRVAVSSACIVAGVATTTALRLVNRMVDDGVLVRVPDELDGRRNFLAIDPQVEQALRNYLIDLVTL